MKQHAGDLLCLYSFFKDRAMKKGYFSCCCCILIHIYSADRRVTGQPCTGNGNRRRPYCYQIRFILLLLNKYVSFRWLDVIYVVISSPPGLGSQLKDWTCHLENDTSIYVKTPHMPPVHLPAAGGLAGEAESQRDCCLVTVTMDATLCQGLRCNGFKLNC